MFANIEDILLTNTVSLPSLHSVHVLTAKLQAFLSSLEKHQKECRLYIDKIGDILLSHLPNMGVYMVGLLDLFFLLRRLILSFRNTASISLWQ